MKKQGILKIFEGMMLIATTTACDSSSAGVKNVDLKDPDGDYHVQVDFKTNEVTLSCDVENDDTGTGAFDLGQHDLVDIKDLIDNPDLLTRLFLIPFREIRQDVLVDIISPVINLQDLTSLLVRAPARSEQPHKQGQNRQNRYKFLHFHLRSLRFLSTFIYNNQQY